MASGVGSMIPVPMDDLDSSENSDNEPQQSEPAFKHFVLEDTEQKLTAREERRAQREAQLASVVFDRHEPGVKKVTKKKRRDKKKEEDKDSAGLFFFEDRRPQGEPEKHRHDNENAGKVNDANSGHSAKVDPQTTKADAVWFDEDDLEESSKDLRQLRRRFEDVYGRNASWAASAAESSAKHKRTRAAGLKSKRGRQSQLSESNDDGRQGLSKHHKAESESESDGDASSTEFEYEKVCRSFIRKPTILQKGTLHYERVRDVNRECELRGRLSAVEFHTRLPLALVAADAACSFGLFRVDGRRNEKLHTAFLDGFSVSCAHFNVTTNEVLLGSKHKNFYVYDMPSARLFDVNTMNAGQSRFRNRHVSTTTESFEVSPDGQFIVFLDGVQLHIVSARTKEWLGQLRAPGRVQTMSFAPLAGGGYALFTFCTDGVVSVWDVASRRCLHSFTDSGCVRASALSVSPSGALLATGHATGIVNIYETAQCFASRTPLPLCAVKNLVTRCTSLRFNASDELLCAASNRVHKAVRLIHVPTRSVFSNFPQLADNALTDVESIDFSPASGYLSLATNTGKALLYRIKHFREY